MPYQIDQSGKIEQTERHTVLACANSDTYTLLLRRSDKRLLQQAFKQTDSYRLFPYLIFAAAIALVIHKNQLRGKLIIDREYIGHEDLIENMVHQYLGTLHHYPRLTIEWGHVGKLSVAHTTAYLVARNRQRPTHTTNTKEVFTLILGVQKDRAINRLTQD